MEVVGSNIAFEAGNEADMSAEKVSIKFGSHGRDEPSKVELNKLSESNLPKDTVDEKAKLDLAEKELQKIFEKLKMKKAERRQIRTQIHSLSVENQKLTVLDEKRKQMEALQQALSKLKGTSGVKERGLVICSSENELDGLIKSYIYRISHESIPLSEEKQILREIRLLEGTREKVIANAAERAKIQEPMGERDAIQDQIKLIGVDLDGVRKEKQVLTTKFKQLDDEKVAVEKEINALEDELSSITEKKGQNFRQR